MEHENQRDDANRLPLHPRKTQELFFELLQVKPPDQGSNTADEISGETSFQQRVASVQQVYAHALKQLQRGQWLRDAAKSREDPLVQLRLSADGAKLELLEIAERDHHSDQDAAFELRLASQVELSSVRYVAVHRDACLAIRTTRPVEGTAFPSLLEAESDRALVWIAVAVASSVSALDASSSTGALLWQAIRLRIVELSACLSLREAVRVLEAAYAGVVARDTESQLPPLGQLFLLRSA